MRRPNHLGIFAGAAVFWIFGAIWFTVFSAPWRAAVGMPSGTMSGAAVAWSYILAFLAAALIAYLCDNMLWHYERADAAKGAQVGLLAGFCGGCPVIVMMGSFEMRPLALILIDCGYVLIGAILAGTTVGAVRAFAARRAAGSR